LFQGPQVCNAFVDFFCHNAPRGRATSALIEKSARESGPVFAGDSDSLSAETS
jgi:hypothetical protein